jgi:hypothetical protein
MRRDDRPIPSCNGSALLRGAFIPFGVFVATSEDVREHPRVAGGAAELLQDVFGTSRNPEAHDDEQDQRDWPHAAGRYGD